MKAGPRIDYKALRKVSPETARLAVLEYLKTNGRNMSNAARVFGINRPVVYDILGKRGKATRRIYRECRSISQTRPRPRSETR